MWAPHYTIHKTFMGLVDAATLAGNQQALAIADAWAPWFHEWTAGFSREQMNDILDVETGGMLEVWADLYGFTGKCPLTIVGKRVSILKQAEVSPSEFGG